jgi:hypothetical protein
MGVYAGPANQFSNRTDSNRIDATTKLAVQSGLVLNLDAGASTSYPGSGTTWTDLSGNGNTGTLTNGPTYSSANGGSIVFDGTNDYVNIPYNSILNSSTTFTVDFWFKSNNIAPEQVFFSTTNAASLSSGYHIQVYQSKIILQVYPGGAYTFSSQTLSSNTFYNVSVTYNSGNIIYYINGTSAGTANYTFTPSSIDAAIGKFTYNNSLYVNGNIPSLKFYSRALSATEVSQNFNATRSRFGI